MGKSTSYHDVSLFGSAYFVRELYYWCMHLIQMCAKPESAPVIFATAIDFSRVVSMTISVNGENGIELTITGK